MALRGQTAASGVYSQLFVRIRGVDKQRVCDAACCQRFIHAVCNGADVGIQRLCSVYGLAAVFARKFCGDRGVREVFTGRPLMDVHLPSDFFSHA